TDEHDNVLLVPSAAISYASSQAATTRPAAQASPSPAAAGAPGGTANGAAGGARRAANGGAAATQDGSTADQSGGTSQNTSAARVLVLRNGQPQPTAVQIGSSDDRNTEVVSGLQPGDQVIVGQSGGSSSAATRTSGGQTNRTGLPGGG